MTEANVPEIQVRFIEVKQSQRRFLMCALPAAVLAKISYAAIRRQDEEEGAVQRVLNHTRIAGIKSFATQGGDFPPNIVLNWIGGQIERRRGKLVIPEIHRSAQIIDGQHRVAGLEEAIK